jgi:hypothetical protein
MDSKFERVEFEDDPDRCQSPGGQGQCHFKALPGQKRCARHHQVVGNHRQDHLGNYRFSKIFAPRIDELANNDKIKGLREEIALCRMVLETIVNRCKDEFEMSLEADRIQRLVEQIKKLVEACHKIEESTGLLLDKTIVVNIGAMMVNILEKYIPDRAVLDVVGVEIYEAIEKSSRREDTLRPEPK